MKNLLFLIIIISPLLSLAQITGLEQLRNNYEIENSQRMERVLAFSEENNVPIIRQSTSGSFICLTDVINGVPQFIKTHNIGAAVSTGANKIGIEGELGLDLDGEGVAIAIWDGGAVRPTHNELAGRITLSDGSPNYNFHATHVAGTILSRGLNSTSRGMAINATAKTFDFGNDNSEMLQQSRPDQSGTILSNHSYGTVSGWDDGQWFGDPDISEDEDWRFGFYTGGAALWDQIAYNSPYYTIVKSAGNDRGDSGNGTHPADGPYDIISTSGTAKNIITIGAVNKVGVYTQPLDVVMSSFSGWGPTDDGRIKPDFVAAGVGLFSTFESADDSYGTLSGTSMSAPNATGTFALLQQLNKELTGEFMKSALLKGLTAHTAHEAGQNDGPDYSFGWGLINAVGATDVLLKNNGLDVRIEEIRIENGDSYELSINPVIGKEVKATICWTDPAGTIPDVALDPTDLILVNDLDMRISNESETHEPWILDPVNPAAPASHGDNFRDNIEVIEFIPTSESYTLTINHKNTISNNHQDVFLILTYEDVNNSAQVQYWIGNDDDFSQSTNWSTATGGTSDGNAPSENTSLIFDNNSFDGTQEMVNLSLASNTTINDMIYLSNQPITFDLGSNDLIVKGKMSLNENVTFQGTGIITFDSDKNASISAGNALANMKVVFSGEDGNWRLNGGFSAKEIDLNAGSFDFSYSDIQVENFNVAGTTVQSLNLDSASLRISSSLTFESVNNSFSDSGTKYILTGDGISITGVDVASEGDFHIEGAASITGFSSITNMNVSGEFIINNDLEFVGIEASYGSFISLKDQVNILVEDFVVSGEFVQDPLVITSEGNATLEIPGRRKICFDNLSITNVNLLDGGATISVGTSSVISNSSGWVGKSCDNTIFADFDVQYNCEGALVLFVNNSSGNFENSSWDFDGLAQSTEQDPYFEFAEIGTYTISLNVSNGDDSDSFTKEIQITENDLSDIQIVEIEGNSLFSIKPGVSYQWFLNGLPIEGAIERTYVYNEAEGDYFVVVFGENCNLASNTINVTVTGLDDISEQIFVYPNPLSDVLYISGLINQKTVSIKVFDLAGKEVRASQVYNEQNGLYLGDLQKGTYTLVLDSENDSSLSNRSFRIVIE